MTNYKKQAQEEFSMDMTPMIDCVFLLMIFFVLVIDLSQQSLEDLILPKAEYQEPDDEPPDVRPVFNILQSGDMYYKGELQYSRARDGNNYEPVMNMLLLVRQTGGVTIKPEDLGGRMVDLVDDPVLIRADKWTEWHYVGELMKQCSQPQAAFWKVELAMSEQDKEDKLLKK
ncbi:MAG: biopolymer transporter ExbD [Planctomycetota bacterium]|nr:biopolymer transporter ExbD [Planctomycetota bacterium]